MIKHVAKRIIFSILTILIVATITFFLMKVIPGSPFVTAKMSQQTISQMNTKYGLDQPVMVQYFKYMGSLLKGDLGDSLSRAGYTVNQIIAEKFPVSAQLGLLILLVSVVFGVGFGCISAFNQNTLIDRMIVLVSTFFNSIPGFVFAVALLFFFGQYLKVLPTMGLDRPQNYIMPILAASASPTAMLIRMTRTSVLDVLSQDYIRVLKAKGMKKSNILFKHALRNALLPIVTVLGPLTAAILTGNFVVEAIFSIPGMGSYIVNCITQRDYPVIMGTTIFYTAFLVFANLIVDVLYSVIDPRIKLES